MAFLCLAAERAASALPPGPTPETSVPLQGLGPSLAAEGTHLMAENDIQECDSLPSQDRPETTEQTPGPELASDQSEIFSNVLIRDHTTHRRFLRARGNASIGPLWRQPKWQFCCCNRPS